MKGSSVRVRASALRKAPLSRSFRLLVGQRLRAEVARVFVAEGGRWEWRRGDGTCASNWILTGEDDEFGCLDGGGEAVGKESGLDFVLLRRVGDDEVVAGGGGAPAVADAVAEGLEPQEAAGVEELEANVVGDAAAQLRVVPEQPVCVAIVGEDAPVWGVLGERFDLTALRDRPSAREPVGRPGAGVGGGGRNRQRGAEGERPRESPEVREVEAAEGGLEQRGKEHECRQPEPDDAADRCRAGAEREQQRESLEPRDVASVAAEQPDGRERDEVERHGADRGRARTPRVDGGPEQRVGEQLPVVADQ